MWKSFKGLLLIFIAGLAGAALMLYYGRGVNNAHFKKFNENNIQGRLTRWRASSTGIAIYIDDVNKYNFIPEESSLFQNTIAIGDSIIKPAFSRTLTVKKGDKVYQFTFKEFPKKK